MVAIEEWNKEYVPIVAEILWRNYWCEDKDIGDLAVIKQAMISSKIPENKIEELIKRSNESEVKEKLKLNTEDAISEVEHPFILIFRGFWASYFFCYQCSH